MKNREPRFVLEPQDSYAAGLLEGLPYSHQSAGDGVENPVNLGLSFCPKSCEIDLAANGGSKGRAKIEFAAIDRGSVNLTARPFPPPSNPVGLVGLGSLSALGRVGPVKQSYRKASGCETDLLAIGRSIPGIRWMPDWKGFIQAASGYRFTLVNDRAFSDSVSMAKTIVLMASSGVPVVLTPGCSDPRWVHPDLCRHLRPNIEKVLDDDLEWAALAARQRRAAWIRHDLQLVWDGGPKLAANRFPAISVLLVSKRPHLIPKALEMIRNQREIDPEVVVMVHGDEGQISGVRSSFTDLGLSGDVDVVDPSVPFGAVLNIAAGKASGDLVVKWDDDDLYGPNHLLDLVAARRSSRSDLVGKMAEFLHFEVDDETILRHTAGAETESFYPAGGTLCLPRLLLKEVGGFPILPKAVDHHLKLRLKSLGHSIYRTHGFGFALTRTGNDHTWNVSDARLKSAAVRTWKGIPDVLDLGSGQ